MKISASTSPSPNGVICMRPRAWPTRLTDVRFCIGRAPTTRAELGPDRLNLALADQQHALHVEEEDVTFGVVSEPRLEWHGKQVVLQPMGPAAKIRASFSFGSQRIMGSNPMWARTLT